MLRGFYTAASGMIAQQRQQELISNNITNANTPGYKADQGVLRSFPELLINEIGSKNIPTEKGLQLSSSRYIGGLNTGVYVQESSPNYAQGDIRATNNPTDMAILEMDKPDETGGLFFMVRNDAEEVRYTRNGNFTVDGEGYLTTNEGYYVLDRGENPIQTNGLDFLVSDNGIIEAANVNTQLGIVYIANQADLVKEENDLFSPELGNIDVLDATVAEVEFAIKQNSLEGSNVDSLQSMTDMMKAYRSFEMNQRVLKTYDESMQKAANEIGRLG